MSRPRRPWDRTPPAEREYFELLGPGLVTFLPARKADPSSPMGWRPPSGGAWVHIGQDGRVRAFTGKADVGQGTRTALGLLVADILDLPLDAVDLWMGDTDLCPWDMGTFGSRSMPDAAPALYAAATGARDALLVLGAARYSVAANQLEVAGGKVRPRGTQKGTPFSELVEHRRDLLEVPLPGPEGLTRRSRLVGRSRGDPVAEDVVTGRRRFVSDVRRPGMWHAAVLWPPTRGARLVALSSHDGGLRLPSNVVRVADFVGAYASTVAEARAALATLNAQWDLPAHPAEPELPAYLSSHPQSGDDWDTEEDRAGDFDGGFAQAEVQWKAHYETAYIAHVPLETRCAVAEWTGERLTVWLGTQTPFRARGYIAEALGISEDDVRVVVPPTGAGFGGKHGGDVAAAAARLARSAGRPVRLGFTREEEFSHGYLRPMSIIEVAAGVGAAGRIEAWSFHNTNGGSAAISLPYDVANRSISNTLSESPLAQGPYRSLAANANNFARECAVDELAERVRVDPLEFRERNLADERLRTVLRRAAERAGWSTRPTEVGRGFGLAVGREKGGRIATIAEVSVDRGRGVRVERLVSAFEAGSIVHPDNLRSQVEGAHVMALGGALFEGIHADRGIVLNPRLSQYRVPRFSDVPEIDVELVDAPEFPPAGAGETPMIAVAPALANALYSASGLRLRALPLVPTGHLPPVPIES